MSYIIFLSTLVLLGAIYWVVKRTSKFNEHKFAKILSFVLMATFFVFFFAKNGNLLNGAYSLTTNAPFSSPFLCFMVGIAIWFNFASVIILMMYPFFKFNLIKNYAKIFSFISSILSTALLSQISYTFAGTYSWSLCGAFFEITTAISLMYSTYLFVTNKFFRMTKNEVKEFVIALPIVLLMSMPPYIPSLFFGNVGNGLVKGLLLYHRIYLYIGIIFLFGIYALLKEKEPEYSRMCLLFISLVTLISYMYNYDFSRFVTPTSWPLHLCNTAMFIVPLCLAFRMKRLFYFTLFINVLGAGLAMLIPNYNEMWGFTSTATVHFWINHIIAFALPVLVILLGIYERPKLKQFIYSMLWFLAYFIFVLILNAYFTGVGTPTDFFFINSDFIADKLGRWAENLRNTTAAITIGGVKMVFYPIYQLLFFAVYVLLGLAMWFVYAWVFQIQDFYIKLQEKNRKIKVEEYALCAKYNKNKVDECMNTESQNKLVVKNVYKKYGNNEYFSVADASLEVNAGEIFGFLGPNGAGKSTIIKCIVGIQPATSGSIEINGYDIYKQPEMAKMQLGFVPDHYALYEKLTGREYINYVADLYEVSKKERDERMEKYVTMLNMQTAIDNQIRTYSHGMKQKIAIMSALIHNPKLWILDEPLTGLDPTSIFQVKECMKEHARNGNIVFFSSHIIDIVEKLCDRIMIIKRGQIRTSVTLDELKEKNIGLEEFYLKTINDTDDKIVSVKDFEQMHKKDVLNDKNNEGKTKEIPNDKSVKNDSIIAKNNNIPAGNSKKSAKNKKK